MNTQPQPLLPPLPNPDWQLVGQIAAAAVLIAALLVLWRWYRRRRARLALLAAVTGGAFEYLQDVLLPDVEAGTVRLIGATTHNPFFFVNSPLVSRSQIFEPKAARSSSTT